MRALILCLLVSGCAASKQRVELPSGIRLAYVEAGPTDGVPVVLLHGLTDTSRSFAKTLPRLAALRPDLRLFALDLRGHGGSSMPPAEACRAAPERCFSAAELAVDVVAFLDAKGIARAHIVGHSFGGLIAQEVALAHPERVRRLALLATGAGARTNPVIRGVLSGEVVEGQWKRTFEASGRRWPEDAYELVPRQADPGSHQWLSEVWVTETGADPEHLAAILVETSAIRMGTWIGGMRALLSTDNVERLGGLKVPTLTLWPVLDGIFSAEDQSVLRGALEVSTRRLGVAHVWKEVRREQGTVDPGHNLPWVEPDRVAAELAAFLTST